MALPVWRREAKPRPSTDKFAARRVELARAAMTTIAELGYARSSLREIAKHSEFSHGVLHYYFRDKSDLILSSVREFEAQVIARYDAVIASAATVGEIARGMIDALGDSIRREGPLHRFWYDLRTQALFEPAFRDAVIEIDAMLEAMVGRIFDRLAQLLGRPLPMPAGVAYAMFDGMFQRCLLKHFAGDTEAIPQLLATIGGPIAELLVGARSDALP